MEQLVIEAQRREETGDGPARRLRAQGLLPGVVYGRGYETTPVAVSARALLEALHSGGTNVLVDLRVPDLPHSGSVAARIRQIQRDPVKHQPLHVDFQWVSLREKMTVLVPVVTTGEAPGVQAGGVVDLALHEVEVECLPTAIPEHLVIDLSGMEICDSRNVSDLQVPEGVRLLTPEEETVVSIVPPIKEEALAPELAEVEAAPEEEAGETEGQQKA
jgi:large subunit ribosomal protein L25